MEQKHTPPQPSSLKELPVCIQINGEFAAEFACTPHALEDLALGWVATSVGLQAVSSVKNITVNWQTGSILLEMTGTDWKQRASFSQSVLQAVAQQEDTKGIVSEDMPYSIEQLRSAAEKLNAKRSKGLHGAMLLCGEVHIFREDISRHCAFDKAVGSAAAAGLNLRQAVLITTGRISSEFLWKAKQSGLCGLASLKYPSETGALLARAWHIPVVRNVLSEQAEKI